MVNNDDVLDPIFTALSDPTRRAMIARLKAGEMSVADLAKPFAVSKSAITKHLKMLERAQLLERRIEGRTHFCRLNPRPLQEINDWISHYTVFWNDKFDALEQFVECQFKEEND